MLDDLQQVSIFIEFMTVDVPLVRFNISNSYQSPRREPAADSAIRNFGRIRVNPHLVNVSDDNLKLHFDSSHPLLMIRDFRI